MVKALLGFSYRVLLQSSAKQQLFRVFVYDEKVLFYTAVYRPTLLLYMTQNECP